jgi:MioC protein
MRITVLYGTESGNAELVADDVVASLEEEHEVVLLDLQDFDVTGFQPGTLHLIVCSTHGEGDLPESARPFAAVLDVTPADLTDVQYAMFGLGDSTYEHYSRGSEHIDERLAAHGGTRVGVYGRHDAASGDDASRLAVGWAASVVSETESSLSAIT